MYYYYYIIYLIIKLYVISFRGNEKKELFDQFVYMFMKPLKKILSNISFIINLHCLPIHPCRKYNHELLSISTFATGNSEEFKGLTIYSRFIILILQYIKVELIMF